MKKNVKKSKKDEFRIPDCVFCGKQAQGHALSERNFVAPVCNRCRGIANSYALEKVHSILVGTNKTTK